MKFHVKVVKFSTNDIPGQENWAVLETAKGKRTIGPIPVKKVRLHVGQKLVLLTTAEGQVRLVSR